MFGFEPGGAPGEQARGPTRGGSFGGLFSAWWLSVPANENKFNILWGKGALFIISVVFYADSAVRAERKCTWISWISTPPPQSRLLAVEPPAGSPEVPRAMTQQWSDVSSAAAGASGDLEEFAAGRAGGTQHQHHSPHASSHPHSHGHRHNHPQHLALQRTAGSTGSGGGRPIDLELAALRGRPSLLPPPRREHYSRRDLLSGSSAHHPPRGGGGSASNSPGANLLGVELGGPVASASFNSASSAAGRAVAAVALGGSDGEAGPSVALPRSSSRRIQREGSEIGDGGGGSAAGGGGGGGSDKGSDGKRKRPPAWSAREWRTWAAWRLYLAHTLSDLVLGSRLNLLLFCIPAALVCWGRASDGWTFALALMSLAPLAERLGAVTEQTAAYTNDQAREGGGATARAARLQGSDI